MASEDEIKRMAYRLWEEAGQPDGKHLEHYFRAARILEEQEATNSRRLVIEPSASTDISSVAPPLAKPRGKRRSKKTG